MKTNEVLRLLAVALIGILLGALLGLDMEVLLMRLKPHTVPGACTVGATYITPSGEAWSCTADAGWKEDK
jgi:predicted lysophospholipase L1 biosynthesis ABC-type transport system permease subunit